MGWIKVNRSRDKKPVWINTDHMIRVDVFNGMTRIHLTEVGKEGSETVSVVESLDDVMRMVSGVGNEIIQAMP